MFMCTRQTCRCIQPTTSTIRIYSGTVCVYIHILNMVNVSCFIHSRRRKAKRTPRVVMKVTTTTMTRRLLHMKVARVTEKRVLGRLKK